MDETPDVPAAGWTALYREGYAAAVLLTCFGVWLHAADGLMVSTLVPAILSELGGAQWTAWIFAIYETGSIVAGVSSALLALRFGLRRAMAVAALLYAAGCTASALAPAMPVMLIGRVAQGLGGGALVSLALLAVSEMFPPRLMPRAMAAVSLVWGLSAFTGPLVGGVFDEIGWWRGAFWFFAGQAGLLALWVMMVPLAMGRPDEADGSRFPVFRLLFLSAGIIAIAAAGIDVTAVRSTLLVVLGAILLGAFLRLDGARGTAGLLPANPFSLRNTPGAALVMVLFASAATVPLGIFGPVLMATLHGTAPIIGGYVLALESIGWSTAAVVTSGAAERHDPKLIVAGMACAALSVPGLLYAMPNGPVPLIAVFAVLAGVGFGMAWTFVLRRLRRVSSAAERVRYAAALSPVQRFGYALGAAFTGIVANAAGFSGADDPQAALTTAWWIFAAMIPVAAFGLVGAWRFTRQP